LPTAIGRGAVTRRTLEPFGLVAKAGVWYLIARDGETVKTFRVQRIGTRARARTALYAPSTFDGRGILERRRRTRAGEDAPYVATFRMTRRRARERKLSTGTVESRTRCAAARRPSGSCASPSRRSKRPCTKRWAGVDDGVAVEPPRCVRRFTNAPRR